MSKYRTTKKSWSANDATGNLFVQDLTWEFDLHGLFHLIDRDTHVWHCACRALPLPSTRLKLGELSYISSFSSSFSSLSSFLLWATCCSSTVLVDYLLCLYGFLDFSYAYIPRSRSLAHARSLLQTRMPMRRRLVIIWASIPETQILLHGILQALGINHATYTSNLSADERDKAVKSITAGRDGAMVLLGNYRVGSTGLNLQDMCHHSTEFDAA